MEQVRLHSTGITHAQENSHFPSSTALALEWTQPDAWTHQADGVRFVSGATVELVLDPSALTKGGLVLTLSPNKTPDCFCLISYLWEESWLFQTSAMSEGWWSPLKPSVPKIVPRSFPDSTELCKQFFCPLCFLTDGRAFFP